MSQMTKENLTAEEEADVSTDETTEETEEESIDYKAELAKVQKEKDEEIKARKDAEKALAAKAFKERDEKRETDTEEEKPLTKKELVSILATERQATEKVLGEDKIRQIAKSMSGSEEEAELYVETHKRRQFPSNLSLQEQMEETYMIVNRKKILGQNSELQRALRSKETASRDTAGTHHDTPKGTDTKVSTNDMKAIQASGMKWDGKTYTKKVGQKTLHFDPKTNKRWLA